VVRRRSRRARAGLAAVALALALAVPGSAQERSESEIARDLREAEAARDQGGSQLGTLRVELAEARTELVALQERLATARAQLRVAEGQLSLAEDALGDAEAARDAAVENLGLAEQLLARAETSLEQEERQFVDQVALAYKYGAASRGSMYLEVIRQARTPNDVAVGLYHLNAVMDYQDAVVQRVSEARAARATLRDQAAATRRAAERREADAAATLGLVTGLRRDARELTDAIADDEARQRAVLEELEADAAEKEDLLAAVSADVERYATELDEARRRRAAVGGFVCPVRPSWFQNDWGYPRSGGRSHQGTDMFADRHTPIVAVADGTVRAVDHTDNYRSGTSSGDLGGRSISVWTASGEYWYFSHLEAVADGMSPGVRVAAGDVIGFVGNSGNARTTPTHVHVGRYVDGQAVNPYPALAAAC
jgi:murein DD-endopeptidase MepM/ murein hydrolase activator NlpD